MKKIVCFALIFTILINVLGFGFMDVKASAVLTEAAAVGILSIVGGVVIGGLASLAGKAVEDNAPRIATALFNNHQDLIQSINNNGIQNGDVFKINSAQNMDGSYRYWLSPSENVSESDRAFVQKLCDSIPVSETVVNGAIQENNNMSHLGSMGTTVSASVYKDWRNKVNNAIIEAAYNESMGKIATDAIASEAFSNLNTFDWVNSTPQVQLPNVTEYVESTYGGWGLSKAYLNTQSDGNFPTREAAEAAGGTDIIQWGNCYGAKTLMPGYGCGQYCIYNGEIFYHVATRANYANSGYKFLNVNDQMLNDMYNSKGETLASKGCTTTVGLMCGYYYGTEPHSDCNYPTSVTEDDVKSTTSGGIIDIGLPATDITLLNAMKSGLLTPDSLLSISPEGEVTGADGITLAQLQALLDNLAQQLNTDIDLSSLEAYLQAILSACNGALTEQQLTNVINNVQSSIKDYSSDLGAILSAINGVKELDQTQADTLSSIEEQTAAIAAAIAEAKEAELEVDKDDAEIDYYQVQHTGLAEAAAFVENFDLVSQVKGLLNNILDPQEYSSGAPNFEFYYDSDKDGVAETYNAFDLSFLETPLTNANLKDKRHFTQPMTVREFIQYLIIFICYVGFAIKVLRKLPGLFAGGESTAQDGLTMQAIESGKTLKSHIKGE